MAPPTRKVRPGAKKAASSTKSAPSKSKTGLKAGKVGSVKALKASLKKGGGEGYLERVPKEAGMVVRFLTEPEEWIEYQEHYDDTLKFFPCSDNCPGCDEGLRASKRYLARALDRQSGKVIPLVLPKTLATNLMKKYDKYSTMVDRDYELSRDGDGMNTEYDAIPEAPARLKIDRYQDEEPVEMLPLLEAALERALNVQSPSSDDDEDDDEEERPSRRSIGKGSNRRRTIDDDDESDDDDEDDEPRRKAPAKKKRPLSKKR